jgi:hypothetical protein
MSGRDAALVLLGAVGYAFLRWLVARLRAAYFPRTIPMRIYAPNLTPEGLERLHELMRDSGIDARVTNEKPPEGT